MEAAHPASTPSRFRPGYALLAITTIIGAALRVYNVDAKQFWGDEIHTFQVGNEPATFIDLVKTWWTSRLMSDPPLFYILTWLNTHGEQLESHLRYRLLNLLFGIACIPLIYRVVRRFDTELTAQISAYLMALCTFAIQYSQEYRPYSALLFFMLLTMDAFILATDFTWRRWWYLFAATLGLINTHYFGGFGLAAAYPIWAYGLLRNGSLTRQTKWRAILGLPLLLTLVYLPVIIHAPGVARDTAPLFNETSADLHLYQRTKENLNYAADLIRAFMSWRLGKLHPAISLGLTTLLLGGFVAYIIRRPKWAGVVILWTIIGMLISFAFYEFAKFPYDARRNIFHLPVFLLFVAKGISIPYELTHNRARLARIGATVAVGGMLSFTTVAYAWNYIHYDAHGWRDETSQADWRGMAKYIGAMASPGDVVAVPVINNDTWTRLHYSYYHSLHASQSRMISAGSVSELDAILKSGKAVWVVTPLLWDIPKDMFEYLVSYGQWTNFFGGPVVYLQPHASPEAPGHYIRRIISNERQVAALAPYRGKLWSEVKITAPFKAAYKPGDAPPIIDLPRGVIEAEFALPNPADPPSTPTLFPAITPGTWQDAIGFTLIQPSSSLIRFPLRKGKPYLSLQHNGSVRYTFFLKEEGEYDIYVEARHDVPGPITLRTFLSNAGEGPQFVFARQSNRFGIVKGRFRAKAGPNELTLYYNSFNRVEKEGVPDADTVNTFDMTRWKIEKINAEQR